MLRRLSIGLAASDIALAPLPTRAQGLEEYPIGKNCVNDREIFRIVCRCKELRPLIVFSEKLAMDRVQICFSKMRLKTIALFGFSSAVLAWSAGPAVAQFGAPSGIGDTTAQVQEILDQVKAIGIVDGEAIAGKTKEACDALAKADPLLEMVDDSEVKTSFSELKKILECN